MKGRKEEVQFFFFETYFFDYFFDDVLEVEMSSSNIRNWPLWVNHSRPHQSSYLLGRGRFSSSSDSKWSGSLGSTFVAMKLCKARSKEQRSAWAAFCQGNHDGEQWSFVSGLNYDKCSLWME